MTELAIILKKLREKKGITQQKLVELSGLGQGTIGDIERGKIKKGSLNTLEKISVALKLSDDERDELFSILVPKDIKNKILSNRKEAFNLKKSTVSIIELPVYGKASAGNGYINLEQEIYYMPVKKGDFSDRSFLVEVHGDGMYPTFDEGDFALIDPNNVDYIKNKVYVVTFNDESFIKRMTIDERTGYVILKSDNPSYDDIIINIEEQEYLKIEGRVIQIISNKYL